LSNLLLAVLALGAFAVMEHTGVGLWDHSGRTTGVAALVGATFQINVGLMVFNILPIPPLDGSRLLPRSMDQLKETLAPYSLWILLLIINIPFLSDHLVSRPVRVVMNALEAIFRVHVGGFAS
jgi:Zn-dependent protease